MESAQGDVLADVRDGVATVTLNRPASLNALTLSMFHAIDAHLQSWRDSPAVQVVAFKGAGGKAFCAGGDLEWMQSAIDRPEEFEQTAAEAKAIIRSQLDMSKPLICRLNGHAIGLGATLALCCDAVVAHEAVRIADPHVRVGLVAGDGGALLWPLFMGPVMAKRHLLSGDGLSAVQAERFGLISDLVPREQLDAATFELADRLARGAIRAIRWTKITANQALKLAITQHLETGVAYEVLSNATEDHREAVAAFRERREAVFRGR